MTFKFTKSQRLLSSKDFRNLRRANRYLGEKIQIDYRLGETEPAKLGMTVKKKFGKAHDRNRFKRIVREAYRQISHTFPKNLEINIAPRFKMPLSFALKEVIEELQCFKNKL